MASKVWSLEAVEIAHRAYLGNFNLFSDPDWSLLEAMQKETPIGEVHLHWRNHRGRGHWELITQPYRRTTVCKTPRCRVVTITPHGGEWEACDISRQRYEDAFSSWLNNKDFEAIRKRDVAEAMRQERQRQREQQRLLNEAIAEEYGPWPKGEHPHRHDFLWGKWMQQLDEAMADD